MPKSQLNRSGGRTPPPNPSPAETAFPQRGEQKRAGPKGFGEAPLLGDSVARGRGWGGVWRPGEVAFIFYDFGKALHP